MRLFLEKNIYKYFDYGKNTRLLLFAPITNCFLIAAHLSLRHLACPSGREAVVVFVQ